MLKKRNYLFYFITPLLIAFLQVASFDSNYGWYTIFLYSLLFFTCHSDYLKAFCQGIIYGFTFFLFHSSAFLTFIDVNEFAWYYKGLPLIFFMLCSLYSGIYFILLSLNKRYNNGFIKYSGYFLITSGYLWWIHFKCFAMFIINIGNPLFFTFLPIINNAFLTYFYYKIGVAQGTFTLLIINSILAYILEKKGYKKYGITFLGLIIILVVAHYSMVFPPKEGDSSFKVVHMRPPCDKDSLNQILDSMKQTIKRYLRKNKTSSLLFAYPESALPFSFTDSTIQRIGNKLYYNDTINILLGSFFKEDEKIYNSCFLINKGRIILRYDKKNLVPFWEFLPNASSFFLNKLFGNFLKGLTPFSRGNQNYCSFFYIDNTVFLPALCSELFLNSFTSYDSSIRLIFLVNDSHFPGTLLPKIILLYARFIAGTQRKRVFYIATLEGHEIDENGLIVKKL